MYFMLNILKAKQNIKDKYLTINTIKENSKLKAKLNKNEYNNTIYYPSSNKEWFNSIYSYNKSYIKSIITKHIMLNSLFKNYLLHSNNYLYAGTLIFYISIFLKIIYDVPKVIYMSECGKNRK